MEGTAESAFDREVKKFQNLPASELYKYLPQLRSEKWEERERAYAAQFVLDERRRTDDDKKFRRAIWISFWAALAACASAVTAIVQLFI